jgi:mannose-6-phosphate isomerase-like protein (cupin superfamily)
MSLSAPRRVVAGLDANGKSCLVSDGPVDVAGGPPGLGVANVWTGKALAVDNAAPLAEGTAPFRLEQLAEPVYAMIVAEYAPGLGRDDPHMHFTATADHFYVIEGEVVLVLESGDVPMKAGDIGICRGVMHGWRNDSDKVARLLTFVLPAAPLG